MLLFYNNFNRVIKFRQNFINKKKFKFYVFFCKRKKSLNSKILNFFYFLVLLFLEDSEFSIQSIKNYRFNRNYQILFLFFNFFYIIINFLNIHFRMNSENFFFNRKYLYEFFLYYKFYLFMVFLSKKKILI